MRLLTVDQVAERLGEKPTWIYDRVRSGELRTVHVGRYVRFRPEVIEAYHPRDVRCTQCGKSTGSSDPRTKYCPTCRDAVKLERQQRAADQGRAGVRQVIEEAKVVKPCADCGRRDLPPERMHFHHLDPMTKTATVARINSPQAARREIAKCVLLCPACHRARHRKSMTPSVSPDAENGAQLSATDGVE